MADILSNTILAAYEEEINRCFRCGLCRTVCPSFAESGLEYTSPRGRLQLARNVLTGLLDIDDAVVEGRMQDCLNCMRCSEICPAGVRTDLIVLAARGELVSRGKLDPVKRAAFSGILSHPVIMRIAMAIGAVGKRAVYDGNEILQSLITRIMGMADKSFPALERPSALIRIPEITPPQYGETKKRVMYFVGCATNYLYPEVAEATVRILTRNNIEVVVPRGQACCGIPAYSSGDFKTARKLAEKNHEIIDKTDVDCIITDCSSCAAALKHDINALLDMQASPKPVYDLNEFLADSIDSGRDFGEVTGRVTYHDPCHLKRGQNIYTEPRALLSMIQKLDFVEMDEADSCCGGAGTFSYTHHNLSRKIGSRKAENIRKTGAEMVVTPCPSCRMQLEDILASEGMAVQVRHPVELIDMSFRSCDILDNEFMIVDE